MKQIVGQRAAERHFGHSLWSARDHVVAQRSQPFSPRRTVALKLVRQLRFTSGRPLAFSTRGRLDQQTMRGVRQLTLHSATILNRALGTAYAGPQAERRRPGLFVSSGEAAGKATFLEGGRDVVTVDRYERDERARQLCVEYYGTSCAVCGFNFARVYGDIGAGYIHVHHLTKLSHGKRRRRTNPIRDLLPVCPNCHAMLHQDDPPYTPAELRARFEVLPDLVRQGGRVRC